MKIELKLFPTSIKEMLTFTLFLLMLLNGLAYLIFTVIMGLSFSELFSRSWIILVFVPLIQGIIQSVSNRNGLLTIGKIVKSERMDKKIIELMNKINYLEISRDENYSLFDNKIGWKRKLNRMFSGKIKVIHENDTIHIYGKRIILNRIESYVRIDKEFRELSENN